MARLLALENLSKSFGGLNVFRSLNLNLERGERIGIVGPNGAGKSTLFNLISGVYPPSSGTITFEGQDVAPQRSWTRCRNGIGRTFQVPRPFGGMTVHDNLMVAAVHGGGLSMSDARRRVGETLEKTKLESKAKRFASDLNLIDLKRLELARALALKPKLLLLDEIAGGLTTAECAELLAILNAFEDEEVAVIWIEHVIGALTQFVKRIAVLAQGEIIADGLAGDVFNDPMVKSLYLGDAH